MAVALICGCATVGQPPPAEAPRSQEASRYDFEPGCRETVHTPWPQKFSQVVDQPPEPIAKVPPSYPDAAREARIQGQVLIRALVCEHGRVVRTEVIEPIPMLDEAAARCVLQWTFKPARAGDQNVSCWHEIPIRFSLH